MTRQSLRLSLRITLGIAASCLAPMVISCGGASPQASSTIAATAGAPTAPPSATSEPGLVTGRFDDGGSLRSADGKLEVKPSRKMPLELTLRLVDRPPGPPKGWELVSPVFEITAKDQNRAVTKLTAPVDLTFNLGKGSGSVLYYDGHDWQLVDSELTRDGVVTATVDHFTPYTVARPSGSGAVALPSVSPTSSSTAAPSVAVPSPSSVVPSPSASRTPSSTAVATVDPAKAQQALEAAVEKLKGKRAKVSGATGYTANVGIALPAALQTALTSLTASADVYYGLYNAINEAITAKASGSSANGEFTMLIEPKTTFPANTTEAQAMLTEAFPGAAVVRYTPVTQGPTSYTYYGSNSTTAYAMGVVSANGVTIAYVSTGTADYFSTALSTSAVK